MFEFEYNTAITNWLNSSQMLMLVSGAIWKDAKFIIPVMLNRRRGLARGWIMPFRERTSVDCKWSIGKRIVGIWCHSQGNTTTKYQMRCLYAITCVNAFAVPFDSMRICQRNTVYVLSKTYIYADWWSSFEILKFNSLYTICVQSKSASFPFKVKL